MPLDWMPNGSCEVLQLTLWASHWIQRWPSAKRFHFVPISVPEAPPAKRAGRSKDAENVTDEAEVRSGEVKVELESSKESDSDSLQLGFQQLGWLIRRV